MRILLISNIFPPDFLGGYELLAEQVAEHLAVNHEVRVLAASLANGADDVGESAGGGLAVERLLKLEVPFSQAFRLDRRLRRRVTIDNEKVTAEAIDRFNPDVIFYWSQLRLTVGPMRAGKKSGVTRAFTFNDENMRGFVPVPPELSAPARFRRLILDGILFRGNTIADLDFPNSMCISRFTKDRLIRKGVPVENSTIVFQGIPLERFPEKDSPGELHDPVRLLYAGQVLEQKGIPEILTALRVFLPDILNDRQVELTLAGTGPAEFENAMKELSEKVPYRVNWLGKVPYDELPSVYRDHDILLFPSREEAFGLTHLEAMASGLPVIATTTGGHGEVLFEGETALSTRANDPKHLAERIAEMIAAPELAKRLARNGRQMVVEKFTLERYYTEIEEFLKRCKS